MTDTPHPGAIRERHGRKGQPQEYDECAIPSPTFLTQQAATGDYWGVCVVCPNGIVRTDFVQYPTWQDGYAAARASGEAYRDTGQLPAWFNEHRRTPCI